MNTSEKTENDGLTISPPDTEEEIEPNESVRVKNSAMDVRATQYAPQTMQETVDDRASQSQVTTDKFARWILVGSLVLIAASHSYQLFAGWTSLPVFSEGANNTMNSITYIATTVMGYLFGKSALNSKK